ncbi:aspartate aminotransferase family protein [Emcibacter sp. SYSU 3D8]|uniref:aspartate aminotransferase family protein n=1 Tax=Emcibacter sp. SYSU 3D8 TaxID=3133969 RepID=UPI0031FE79E5
MTLDLARLLSTDGPDKYDLHNRYLNTQMVRVLRTIGFDRNYVRGKGQYLYDQDGHAHLDLLSGFGSFAIGRNHPTVIAALQEVLGGELPNLVQMDVPVLAGVLAQRLLAYMPGMEKMFFCNSGAEAVEASIKFARFATGRSRIIFCEHAFHGLTNGALSLNGDANYRGGFEPLLPGCTAVPFNELERLEAELARGDVAAFIVEPIQGKGVNMPAGDYLREAARLCHKHGALFVADEIQTGVGRTGRFLAIEHWDVDADMVLLAKALSGGFIPVGAVAAKKWVYDKVFDRMDRAVVHGSTFAKNDMAMAAGLATLEIIESEGLIRHADVMGDAILGDLAAMVGRHEFVKEVRGKGLMIGIEFDKPQSLTLKAAWALLEQARKGLFCQMIIIPLMQDHRILSQVAGDNMNVIKLLPPLTITDVDRAWIRDGFNAAIADAHRVPGAIWDLGRTLAGGGIKARAGAA